jgi:hypothetical protein
MFEHIKYLLIEYIHLILPVAIIMGLFINNMPVNFGFGKFTDQYIPREFTKAMSKSIGIDAEKYPKAYSFIASIYRALKSIISPDYKTTLFKVIMIIFIISILFGYHYSMVFEECILIITVFSVIFWGIFQVSVLMAESIDSKADPKKWFEENFDNLQVDTNWLLLNSICSLIVTTFIFLIFKIVLNINGEGLGGIGQIHAENSSKGLIGSSSFFNNMNLGETLKKCKEYPVLITIILSILILTLYYRIDGIAYLGKDIGTTIYDRGEKWWNNFTTDPHPEDKNNYDRVYNIIWFIIYFSIFVYIISYQYINEFKVFIDTQSTNMKHLSLFNILADETHHPILVFAFYFYFFLCREKYTSGWFFVFVFATCIEYLKTTGKLDSLFGKMAGKVAGNLPPGMKEKLSDVKGAASEMVKNVSDNLPVDIGDIADKSKGFFADGSKFGAHTSDIAGLGRDH